MKNINVEQLWKEHPKDVRKAIHFAIIMKRGKTIAVGYNRWRFSADRKFTSHAEEQALKKAGRRARGAIMIVFRVRRKDYKLSTAKPCYSCQFLMDNAGIIHTIDLYEEMKK